MNTNSNIDNTPQSPTEAERRYADIIGLPHFEPRSHRRMPDMERAAQFAPFAALTGHDDAIRATAAKNIAEMESI